MAVISTKSNLALKIYAETLAAFERKNVFMDIITKQTIQSGKSAQFIVDGRGAEAGIDPATGLPTASQVVAQHTIGQNQRELSSQMIVTERTITVERPLVVRKELDAFEEKMAHYQIRNMITGQNGSSMANYLDRRVIVELNKAMNFTNYPSTDTQYSAGIVYNGVISSGSTAEAKGDAMVEAIFGGNSVLDGKDQVGKDRFFVTTNSNYYNLLLSQKAINRDFNAGDNGSIADGNVFKIGDTYILRSNNLVDALLTNATNKSGYGNTVAGLLFTSDVVGMVELMGLATDEWFDKDYDQTIMKVQLAGGWGVLNPGSLVAITAGTANS